MHNGPTELVFKARALLQSGKESPLSIAVRCGDMTRQCTVRLALPQPNVVLLRALRLTARLDGPTEPRPECESVLRFDQLAPQRLEPFANRPTTYSFELVNRSGLKKSLLVKTYVLPDHFWDNQLNSSQACDLLARSATLLGESAVDLAEMDKPTKLAFPALKPPAKAAEKPPDKPSPQEPANPSVDISAGLAMVVCDAKTKEPRWLQVYTFAPLRPASYLDEPKAKYDPADGKLEIDVALTSGRDLPPCSAKAPMRLAMALRDANGKTYEAAGQGGEGLPGQTKALLYSGQARDSLYAHVPSTGRETLQVEIDVDDYPRAILYALGRSDVTWERNLWRIRITDPPHQPVIAIQPRDALAVKLGVDSPADSFLSSGPDPSLRVGAPGTAPMPCGWKSSTNSARRQATWWNSTAIARSRSSCSKPMPRAR